MSNKPYDYLIKTKSKEERKALIDYLTDKDGFILSDIDDYEGERVVAVSRRGVSIFCVASNDVLEEIDNVVFSSSDDFISFLEAR